MDTRYIHLRTQFPGVGGGGGWGWNQAGIIRYK